MHASGTSPSFSWLRWHDRYVVPLSNIICKISAPTTAIDRQYKMNSSDLQNITVWGKSV